MPRPSFGKLSQIWSDDPEAAALILDYRDLATAWARAMERMFPGEDFEEAYMEALYLAAFTATNLMCPFDEHLWRKVRDQNSNLKYRFRRMSKVPIESVRYELTW